MPSTKDARSKELRPEVVQKIRELFPDYPKVDQDPAEDSAEDPAKEVWSLRAENERLRADVAALHSDVAKLKHDIELRDIQIKHHNTSIESKIKEVEQLQAELDEQKQLVKLNAMSIANLSQSLKLALPAPAPTPAPSADDEPDEDLEVSEPDEADEDDEEYTLTKRVRTSENALKRAIKGFVDRLHK